MDVGHYAKRGAPIAATVDVKTRVKVDAKTLAKVPQQIIGNSLIYPLKLK